MSHLHSPLLLKSATAFLAMTFMLLTACTTTGTQRQGDPASQRRGIDAGVDATLARLYEAVPESRTLASRAEGVLVFPSVLSASLVIGGQHGDGALRVGGKTIDYYTTSAGSIGFQAGAQSRAIVLIFMTSDSLSRFRQSEGWTVGADATVAIAEIGATGSIDTNTMKQPVVGFVMSNAGIIAGVSLQGAKIYRKRF
jgi:lipid-binding SYLF domain-containing protein